MEATQILTDTSLDDSVMLLENEDDKDAPKRLIGVLVFDNGKEFPVFKGDNISVGRDPEHCQIVIDDKSLSRVHAILEVDKRDGEVIIYDNKSMNHTWRDGKKLKPLVRYQLGGGEKLKFGCVSGELKLYSQTSDASKTTATYIGAETGDDSHTDFVPETPINIFTRRRNTNNILPHSNFKKTPDDKTEANTLFVPESQNTPCGSSKKITVSKTSNVDLHTMYDLGNNYISKEGDPSFHSPKWEKVGCDDDSCIAQTQEIPPNSSISPRVNIYEGTLGPSSTNIVAIQSNHELSEMKLLYEETQRIVPKTTIPNAFDKKSIEYSSALTSQFASPTNKKAWNIPIVETPHIPEQNLSLLMAETQKINQYSSGMFERVSQDSSPLGSNVWTQETQKISIIDGGKSSQGTEVTCEFLYKCNKLKAEPCQKETKSGDDKILVDSLSTENRTKDIQDNRMMIHKVIEKEKDKLYDMDSENRVQNNKIEFEATNSPTSNINPSTEQSLVCEAIVDPDSLNPVEATTDVEDVSCCSYGSENLLSDLSNDANAPTFTSDSPCQVNNAIETEEKEYEEIYEGATQILSLDDAKETSDFDALGRTKLDADDEDMILSSQGSISCKRNITDLISRTMSLTQGADSKLPKEEAETQYDNTDMNISTQLIEGHMCGSKNPMESRVCNASTSNEQISVSGSGHSAIELTSESVCTAVKAPKVTEISNTQGHSICCDSDEDSIDMLPPTQELINGLIADELLKGDKNIAEDQAGHQFTTDKCQLRDDNVPVINFKMSSNYDVPQSGVEEERGISTNTNKRCTEQDQPTTITISSKETDFSLQAVISGESVSFESDQSKKFSSNNLPGNVPVAVQSPTVVMPTLENVEENVRNEQNAETVKLGKMSEFSCESSQDDTIKIKKNQSFLPEDVENIILSSDTRSVATPISSLSSKPKTTQIIEDPKSVMPVQKSVVAGDDMSIKSSSQFQGTKEEAIDLRHIETAAIISDSKENQPSLSNEIISSRRSRRNKSNKLSIASPKDEGMSMPTRSSSLKIARSYASVNTRKEKNITSPQPNEEVVGDTYIKNRPTLRDSTDKRVCIASRTTTKQISNPRQCPTKSDVKLKKSNSTLNKTEIGSIRTLRTRTVAGSLATKSNKPSTSKQVLLLSGNKMTRDHITPQQISMKGKSLSEECIENEGLVPSQNRKSTRSSASRSTNYSPQSMGASRCLEPPKNMALQKYTKISRKRGPKELSTSSEDSDSSSKRNKKESSVASINSVEKSSPSRKRIKQCVMFTGYDDPQHQRYLKDLGAEIALTSKDEPTVLVTDKLGRTVKLLCALGRGIPIVSKNWVTRCKSVKAILDPNSHIIEDKEMEKKFGFCLKKSIEAASKSPLLLNYRFHATKSCTPPPEQIKEIVECAGGTWLKQMPKKSSDDIIIISCPEDKNQLKKAINSGFNVQDKEFLLTGLLKQSLNFESYVLSIV